MGGDGLVAEGVEDPAFGAYGGSFNDLAGVTRDEDEGGAGCGGGRYVAGLIGVEGLRGDYVPVFWFAFDEGDGDDGFAFGEFEFWKAGGIGRDGDFGEAEVTGGFFEGCCGP